MIQNNRNKLLVSMVMILAIGCLSFLTKDKDVLVFKGKNLKVLPKNISKEQLDEVMKGFNQALGVKCVHCHVKNENSWDFASDEKKEKHIARKMFTMTRSINKKYFGVNHKLFGTVTCMTCHQGGTKPKGKPE
jgi:predicted metal-binding protein